MLTVTKANFPADLFNNPWLNISNVIYSIDLHAMLSLPLLTTCFVIGEA